eukprot:TRINITY_DN87438_c0_g1_i1.p1 TRINITY_DN87438_c0_g1~~TRINITY_DN87438_c0_g1_i1.p1  ORF type:complete len:721 (-),score=122.97 TRINITY_DN87438_c0_g1_i1:137-2299(-)
MGWLNDLGNAAKKVGTQVAGEAVGVVKFDKPTNQWFQGVYCEKADWMSMVPDDVLLTEMWVPGTHDSGSDRGGDIAQCQNLDLRGQLNVGIRFFDIRAKHEYNALPIYHGIVYMHKSFDDIVTILEDFLNQHPSEAIFVRIKKEGDEGAHNQDFSDLVKSKLTGRWVGPERFGKLGDFRGKIIMLASGSNVRLPGSQKELISKQDKWECGNHDQKRNHIRDLARSGRDSNRLYLSYISCTGTDGIMYRTPAMMAEPLNKTVYDEIGSYNPGIYVFDFPGSGLTERVIARNRTDDKRQALKEQFRSVDKDGNGMISRSELAQVLQKTGQFDESELDYIYSECDANNDGQLNYEEFIEWALSPPKDRPQANGAVARGIPMAPPPAAGLVYGAFVSLQHIVTKKFLHSHNAKYPGGSRQQQVTCFEGDNDDNAWLVKAAHGQWCTRGKPVANGDIIRLQHMTTGKNLHSHGTRSPVTGQQEVCGYGDDGNGDTNDNWRIEYEGDKFRLIHVNSNHALHSHGIALPAECFGQQEVTSYSGRDDNDFWLVDETELPAVLIYGSRVCLRHAATDVYLHSHAHGYPSGSGQQQVTGYNGHDDHDNWIVQGPLGQDTDEGKVVGHGEVLRLSHEHSKRWLHSHNVPAMVSSGQHEVSCFGDAGNSNNDDNWRVEYEGDKLRLIHVATNHALHSHERDYPAECFNQQEITCYAGRDGNDLWIPCDVMIN